MPFRVQIDTVIGRCVCVSDYAALPLVRPTEYGMTSCSRNLVGRIRPKAVIRRFAYSLPTELDNMKP